MFGSWLIGDGVGLKAVERRWSQPWLDAGLPTRSVRLCCGKGWVQAMCRAQVWRSVARPRLSSRRRLRAAARVWIHQLFAAMPR